MNEDTLLVKERVEIAFKLGDYAWRDFDTRRTYEWKANLALWAALGGFSYLFLKGEAKPFSELLIAIAISILVAIDAVYILVWTPGLFRRNRCDQDAAHFFWAQAAALSGFEIQKKARISKNAFTNWSHLSQIMITLFLTLVAILAILKS